MRALLGSRILGFALLATTTGAWAQDPRPYPDCSHQPTEGDVSAAKGAFQAGQASFNEADYNRAITYWEDAYRRDCTAHALLLNLARAYELNGQKKHAVISLETFLARNPSSPQRDQIAKRIEVLNEKIAAERSTSAPSDGTGTATGTGTAAPTNPGAPKGDQPEQPKRNKLPLYVAIGGGAVFVLGSLVYLGASSDVKAAEDACGGNRGGCTDEIAKKGNEARDRQATGGALAGIGLVVGAGGAIWYLMTAPKKDQAIVLPAQRAPQIAPQWAPGYAGLNVSGSF